MMGRLLLASNSTNPGKEYLSHLSAAIVDLFSGSTAIAFVPYALADLDAYSATAERSFKSLGLNLRSIHRQDDQAKAISQADGVFIGGGNTFRLLDNLVRRELVEPIQRLVREGGSYMGTSAGSNLACPTIRTTNDMPIVQPATFDSLNLVTFQINPHYLERDPDTAHGGETRRQRLAEFHEENTAPVIALPEGSWLEVNKSVILGGPHRALLFRRGFEPTELNPGELSPGYLRPTASPSVRKL